MTLRLIGDIHGEYREIYEIIRTQFDYDLTIQLGDFGVGFGTVESYLNDLNSDRVKILHGNHDNPTILANYPHDLGRFGVYDFYGMKIFFVAGAWSIDQQYRKPGFTWWHNEELSFKEITDCLDLWEKVCNDIDLVITHDCPNSVSQIILKKAPILTSTGRLLEEMFKIHQPPKWRFAHWHLDFECKIGNTKFKCLNINKQEVFEV